jgi:adenylate kinase
LIFESGWQDLVATVGRENLRFPKEIILLGGAPGAGKGTNTAFIAKARSLTCGPIVMSALLDSPRRERSRTPGTWSATAKWWACCCASSCARSITTA